MDGEKISKIIKESHSGVYGTREQPANAFLGGNVGMIAIALGLSEIADSLRYLGFCITQSQGKNNNEDQVKKTTDKIPRPRNMHVVGEIEEDKRPF